MNDPTVRGETAIFPVIIFMQVRIHSSRNIYTCFNIRPRFHVEIESPNPSKYLKSNTTFNQKFYLVQSRTKKPRDLLDQSIRGHESIIRLGQLLHLLLVLVQLLQVISGHVLEASSLGFITVSLVTKDTDLELGSGDVLQPIRIFFTAMFFQEL